MAKKNNNKFAGELNQQSLDYLGLNKQPFASEILTEKSFFNSQALTKITDSLTHQIQFSDLLLLIEGDQGSGKTSLFRQFIQTDIANTKTLSMQAEATDTLVQIQQKISIHLQDLGDANHLDDNLKNLQMFDQTPLVIIDNVHVLSDTTLQELFRYQQQLKQEHDVTLKILFFANSGMTETLQKITDIQTDQMYVQAMPRLSPKQLDSYITHKLRSAGYSGKSILENNDIQQLFKKCNGTPLDIMIQAAPFIDKAITRKVTPASAKWVKALVVIITLFILITGGYITYTYFLNEKPADTPTIKSLISEIHTPDTTSLIEESPTETVISDEPDVISILKNDDISLDVPASIEPDSIDPEPDHTSNQADTIETTQNKIIIEEESIQTTTKNTVAEKDNTKEAPETPNIEVDIKAKIKTAEPLVTAPQALHPTLQQLNKMGLQDANWLQQQNSNNWTLQLLGARDPETLLKFAQGNNLASNTAWYKTWLASKPYYVLIHGSYTNRNMARNAIDTLPQKLRSLKPWVKSMKSVQQALK